MNILYKVHKSILATGSIKRISFFTFTISIFFKNVFITHFYWMQSNCSLLSLISIAKFYILLYRIAATRDRKLTRLYVGYIFYSDLRLWELRSPESIRFLSLSLFRPCLRLLHSFPRSFSRFLTSLSLLFLCSLLPFESLFCSHARGILWDIYTSCMGSPFPWAHTG